MPYFSQWETAGMTTSVYAGGSSALLRDPLWKNSGADTVEEYAHWGVNICGMACLKMILSVRGEIHPTISLARICTAYGGYVVDKEDASIRGLIYTPFVSFVVDCFGIAAEAMTGIDAARITTILSEWQFLIASVNSDIRFPNSSPSVKGGHLVLITAATSNAVQFHNPSGHDASTRADVVLPLATFDRFFANRGIVVSSRARPL